jgi:hypothetical protein
VFEKNKTKSGKIQEEVKANENPTEDLLLGSSHRKLVNTHDLNQLIDEALFHARLHPLLILTTIFFVQLGSHGVCRRIGVGIAQQ